VTTTIHHLKIKIPIIKRSKDRLTRTQQPEQQGQYEQDDPQIKMRRIAEQRMRWFIVPTSAQRRPNALAGNLGHVRAHGHLLLTTAREKGNITYLEKSSISLPSSAVHRPRITTTAINLLTRMTLLKNNKVTQNSMNKKNTVIQGFASGPQIIQIFKHFQFGA
jgi:hypothetical protein